MVRVFALSAWPVICVPTSLFGGTEATSLVVVLVRVCHCQFGILLLLLAAKKVLHIGLQVGAREKKDNPGIDTFGILFESM